MDEVDPPSSERPWYYDLLMELDAEGWAIANIEAYLGEDQEIGSERLLYLEYALELARSLQERTAYLGRSAGDASEAMSEGWADELHDPMNAEGVLEHYEAWAREHRPWEPALYRCEEDWRDENMEQQHAELLVRFDTLDPSSKPSTVVMLPLLAYPQEFEAIDQTLGAIEDDERRQRATITRAVTMLKAVGYDVDGIEHLAIIDGLDRVARLHDLHDLHEDLRLLIAEQIAPFDPELAAHHEQRRHALIEKGPSADIGGLRLQISSIADNLHHRMAMLNDLLNAWRSKGIKFPHDDGIRPSELLEWEANLPEIEATLKQHLVALERYHSIKSVWPQLAEKVAHCAGVLEETEAFLDLVDALDQQWKQLEIEAITRVEVFEHAGLVMDGWHEHIRKDPKAALESLKHQENALQHRIDLIEQLNALDTSFDGADEVGKRIDLLREMDADDEVIEDTVRLVAHYARRGARHRRMLEQDWRNLVAQGKASDSTPTASFSLGDFEQEIAHIRRHGTSVASSSTGASLIAGEVHDRLKKRLEQELALLSSSGWSVEGLRNIAQSDTVLASRKLNAARPHIEEHSVLIRRLVCLPWNRDVALALDVEASLRDPLKGAVLSERVASYAQHLASRPIEDEAFELTTWSPRPARKTLLPVPELEARRTMMPADALGDAHEAILNAMEGNGPESETARIHTTGPAPAIIRPNEQTQPPVQPKVSPQKAARPLVQPQPVQPSPQPQPMVTMAPVADEPVAEVHPSMSDAGNVHGDVKRDMVAFLRSIDCVAMAEHLEQNGSSALPEVRRALAQHVGLEPRDSRVDRFLRLTLRLMPKGDDDDGARMKLLGDLGTNTKKIKRWMRTRLEHRHSGSVDNFLVDAANLGEALDRIPGPGYRVPLAADTKELPSPSDLAGLDHEVSILIGLMNPASAGGITA
ncbi:MAG: hypothetical protein P8Q98_07435 [Candidatus Poseidoniaceae archaeon]|nr:hypothetical protein [Candidatus Poseidoniaceae archaeon]